MPLAPGSRIGTHEVVSLVGQGGMGEVYRARDTKLGRDVAIKRLPDELAADPERLARFEREARALAALNHPNVAQIYAVEAGTIVMELVPGETLRGPVPLERALDYASQIAAALDAAHDKGIVHRDLKPGNIMVTPDGVVKVLDFSLAGRDRGAVSEADSSATLTAHATSAGMIVGTAAYMAPEQAAGKPVDKRADIFAFGVVLWEMLTGRQMFEGETTSHVLAAVLTKDPDLTAVPPRVRHLIARCLEKDPKKRLRDIGDAMSLVQPPGAEAAASAGATGRRLPSAAGWIAAAALAAAVLALVWGRSAPTVAIDPPTLRFAIARAQDIYNQTATAFAVSPDGLTLAYYDAASDGRHAVFLRTLASGDVRELPDSRTFSPRRDSLFWSPDGRQLVRGMQGSAFVVDVATGTARLLCECAFAGGAWNRDGVILLGAPGQGSGHGIRRVSAADRAPAEITKVDPLREQDRWPVFLPDGQRFLFTRTTVDGGVAAYVGFLDGREPKRMAEGSPRVVVPSTAGRGSYVIGIDAAGAVAQPFDLETLTLKGSATTVLAGAVTVSGSENGVLAASEGGMRPRVVPTWFDRKGTSLGPVGEAALFESVALSADGRVLAAAESTAGSGKNDIWVRDVATGVKTRLTFNPDNDSTPVWSPDGRRVAYTSLRGRVPLLYQRSADGTGNETPLFDYDREAYVNDWSSDGRSVIYSSKKSGSQLDNDLYVLPMTGGSPGTPVPYLVGPGKQQQAQFSPDGRFVAYGSDESGTFEIYVQPFPDPSQGKWMVSNGGGVEPRWSRDGKELFYFAGQTLKVVPVSLKPSFSNGAPASLFDAPIQAGYTNDSHRWQLAPDGQRFLLLIPAGRQQAPPLDVIVNWATSLKR